ncbi:MAG TPA: hypothetical protein VGO25_06355 [Rhodanobacteraceae bacterium]|nr:hypothetical protein [Rhodanobacteraceae bacterium]
MYFVFRKLPGAFFAGAIAALPLCAIAQVSVLTERYDDARTGANLAETQLTTANVNIGTFGKLWSYAVDGGIYAQPLYVANVDVPGIGTRNVLYLATMNDVVYAFDADSPSMIWMRDLRNPATGVEPVPIVDITNSSGALSPVPFNAANVVGGIGIESTPVIDAAAGTLYLVARTRENGGYVQRLHALDIATGNARANSPTVIQGAVLGSGDGGTTVTFDPFSADQRASLALANSNIYIAWAAHEDLAPWHGWVMSYDKTALNRTGILCLSPNGANGGIWMGGRAPVIDASGHVYYMVGNGDWDGTANYGQSFVRIGAPNAGFLSVQDYFTPDNWTDLNGVDFDLGSSGPVLIPGTNLIVGGGKQSLLYLTDTTSLGGFLAGNTQINQIITVNDQTPPYSADFFILAGGPVFWNNTSAPRLYVSADNDNIKAYAFGGALFNTTPIASTILAQPFGGGVMTLSSNASTAGSGILWVSLPSASGGHGLTHAQLHALDASTLMEIWNSDQNTVDNMGYWPKFSPPTVANGHVYVGSLSGSVSAYGLLPAAADFSLSAAVPILPTPLPGQAPPVGQVDPSPLATANPGGVPRYVISANGTGFVGNIDLSVDGLPPGVSASWSPAQISPGQSSTLTLSTSNETALGSYQLTITGSSGALAHTTTIVLDVIAPQATSIEFWTNDCTPNGMAISETAGVVPEPYWNAVQYNRQPALSGPFRVTPALLVDKNGTSVATWASWNADNESANSNIPDNPGNQRFMRCYLDPSPGTSATVIVSNLPANSGGYAVYVYADADNGSTTGMAQYQLTTVEGATTSVTIVDNANADFNGTFVLARNSPGNYTTLALNSTGFTLTATPVGSSHAPINGIQIVPDRIFNDGFDP